MFFREPSSVLVFDHEKRLTEELATLDDVPRAAFLLGVCERLVPYHERLCKSAGWDSSPLRAMLDEAWQLAEAPKAPATRETCRKLEWSCAFVSPDTDEMNPFSTPAACAVRAVEVLLQFLAHGDPAQLTRGATCATDAIDCVQFIRSELTDEEIEDGVLMQRELSRQIDDLERIRGSADALQIMRAQWWHSGAGVLDPS